MRVVAKNIYVLCMYITKSKNKKSDRQGQWGWDFRQRQLRSLEIIIYKSIVGEGFKV